MSWGRIQNEILSSLPDEEYRRLSCHFRLVNLGIGQVLSDVNDRLDFAYFPTTAVLSLVHTMQNGATMEIAAVGNDGMLGATLALDGHEMPSRAVIQIAGAAVRLNAQVLREEIRCGGPLASPLLRYVRTFITTVSQTAACSRLHSIEQRLCRWLLRCQDWTQSETLHISQEFISQMLGVRRESITVASGHLQDQGFIQSSRGCVHILNRAGLEASACECYAALKLACRPPTRAEDAPTTKEFVAGSRAGD